VFLLLVVWYCCHQSCFVVAKLLTVQWSLISFVKLPSFRRSFLYFCILLWGPDIISSGAESVHGHRLCTPALEAWKVKKDNTFETFQSLGPEIETFQTCGPETEPCQIHGPEIKTFQTPGPETETFQTHGPETETFQTHGPKIETFQTHGPEIGTILSHDPET